MADGRILLIPPNGDNIIQAGQITPDTVIQTPGFLQYAGQQLSHPPLISQVELREKLHKAETKTLGAIQIIIGLIHIGLGGISTAVHGWQFVAWATLAGYPFWGGLFFIASGSLSISAEKLQTIILVKSSMGMNITCAVMAMIGIVLYITDLAINPLYYFSFESPLQRPVGLGLGILLLMFSSLEFCITFWTAHFWCQANSSSSDMGMMVAPYSVRADGVIPGGACSPPSPPPPYDFVVSVPKREDSSRSQERH